MSSMHEVKQLTNSRQSTDSQADYPQGSDKVIDALNQCLSHAIDLSCRTKQAFWSARSRNFYALHKMFDDFRSDLDSIADELASRVIALGGSPAWIPAVVASTSKLPDYPPSPQIVDGHLMGLFESYRTAIRHVNSIMNEVAKTSDYATSSVIVGYIKLLDEQAALVSLHVPGDRTALNTKNAAE